LVEGVEADVFAGGSLEFLGVVVGGGTLLGGTVVLIIHVEVFLFGLLVLPAFVIVEDGWVEFVDFFVLLVGCLEPIE
jgi:hypothetical protein